MGTQIESKFNSTWIRYSTLFYDKTKPVHPKLYILLIYDLCWMFTIDRLGKKQTNLYNPIGPSDFI